MSWHEYPVYRASSFMCPLYKSHANWDLVWLWPATWLCPPLSMHLRYTDCLRGGGGGGGGEKSRLLWYKNPLLTNSSLYLCYNQLITTDIYLLSSTETLSKIIYVLKNWMPLCMPILYSGKKHSPPRYQNKIATFLMCKNPEDMYSPFLGLEINIYFCFK